VPDFSLQYSFDVQPGLTAPVYAPAFYPHAISDVGTIAGSYMLRGQSSGFTFDTKTDTLNINVVPPIPGNGTTFSHLGGINDYGTVAGWIFPLSSTGSSGVVVHNGSASTFAYPGSLSTQALGLNEFGQVAGYYTDERGTEHGFFGAPGRLQSFDVPDATSRRAEAINDWGQIVGSYVDSSGMTHGFVDRYGKVATVDVSGASATTVSGINDWGQLVGSYTDSNGASHGFVRTFGHDQTLDAPNASRTDAYGINNLGEIVGSADITTTDPGGGSIQGSEVWVAKPSFLQGNTGDAIRGLAASSGLSSSDQQTLSSLLQSVGSGTWSYEGSRLATIVEAVAKPPAALGGGAFDNVAAAITAVLNDRGDGSGHG